jgi:hypothetical protein
VVVDQMAIARGKGVAARWEWKEVPTCRKNLVMAIVYVFCVFAVQNPRIVDYLRKGILFEDTTLTLQALL